jgi:hypothetical protein
VVRHTRATSPGGTAVTVVDPLEFPFADSLVVDVVVRCVCVCVCVCVYLCACVTSQLASHSFFAPVRGALGFLPVSVDKDRVHTFTRMSLPFVPVTYPFPRYASYRDDSPAPNHNSASLHPLGGTGALLLVRVDRIPDFATHTSWVRSDYVADKIECFPPLVSVVYRLRIRFGSSCRNIIPQGRS